MFSRVRIAIRFFFVGLAVGVLLAPRSGEETRRLVRQKADRLLNDVLDAASLGTYESGTGTIAPSSPGDEEETALSSAKSGPGSAKSGPGNGSSRTRGAKSTPSAASEAGV